MNNIDAISNQLWDYLNSITAQGKSKEDQIKYISSVLIELSIEQRSIGSNAMLNHFRVEVENLTIK